MKMSHSAFGATAVKAGFLWALAAAPFALALGAGAGQFEGVVQLFFGSKWFAFKAVAGVIEIVVFGVAAGITQQGLAITKRSGDGEAV